MNSKMFQQIVFALLAVTSSGQVDYVRNFFLPSNSWSGFVYPLKPPAPPTLPTSSTDIQLAEIKVLLAHLQIAIDKSEKKSEEMFAILQSRLQKYEGLLSSLTERQDKLEADFARFSHTIANSPVVTDDSKNGESISLLSANQNVKGEVISSKPRTCFDARELNPALPSGFYWIDPDGESIGEDPINVFCNMTSGSTFIDHDSRETLVNSSDCFLPGCFSRDITYSASKHQIDALVKQSGKCRQSIRYDCSAAPLESNGVRYSWWEDKNGQPRYFWSGNDTKLPHTCQCGIDKTCLHANVNCNCDAGDLNETFDEGYISVRDILPVKKLRFGPKFDTQFSGRYSLGPLECHGVVIVKGIPTSCMDVWRIGHQLSGIYSIRGNNRVHSVFCDFTKPFYDTGFEVPLGYVDIKSASVYFQVQRHSGFSSINTAVTYDKESTSQGRAINIDSGVFVAPRPGKYFFAFGGVKQTPDTQAALVVNNETVTVSSSSDAQESLSLLATLDLKREDKVFVILLSGSLANSGLNQFSGFFLEEDLSFRNAQQRKRLGTAREHQ